MHYPHLEGAGATEYDFTKGPPKFIFVPTTHKFEAPKTVFN
jgi:hypothetical protein